MSAVLELPLPLRFEVPPELEAGEPPEARGKGRDDIRLMVAHRHDGRLVHARFEHLPRFLAPGDLVVINTSRTLPASLSGITPAGERLHVHLSTRLPDGRWLVELRRARGDSSIHFLDGWVGLRLVPPAGGRLRLTAAFDRPRPRGERGGGAQRTRLLVAELHLPERPMGYLGRQREPIRYPHARGAWPLSAYQTIYPEEPGSAEMPSAGRGFTPELITRLGAKGVLIAPIVLHTGVSSQEEGEVPYPELYRVPRTTASLVNAVKSWRGRVVAVGTTVVRALESAADDRGTVSMVDGWTDLVVTRERGVKVVDGCSLAGTPPRPPICCCWRRWEARRWWRRPTALPSAAGTCGTSSGVPT